MTYSYQPTSDPYKSLEVEQYILSWRNIFVYNVPSHLSLSRSGVKYLFDKKYVPYLLKWLAWLHHPNIFTGRVTTLTKCSSFYAQLIKPKFMFWGSNSSYNLQWPMRSTHINVGSFNLIAFIYFHRRGFCCTRTIWLHWNSSRVSRPLCQSLLEEFLFGDTRRTCARTISRCWSAFHHI